MCHRVVIALKVITKHNLPAKNSVYIAENIYIYIGIKTVRVGANYCMPTTSANLCVRFRRASSVCFGDSANIIK